MDVDIWTALMFTLLLSFLRKGSVFGITNVALHKSARQSSTAADGHTSRAVDGDTNGTYTALSCTHTSNGYGEWWEVDLFGFYHIQKVEIFNRVDCCGTRLNNFTINVFWNDPLKFLNEKPYLCGHFPNAAGITTSITCPPDVRGRYVRVTLFSHNPLALCEVMVYGVAVSKPGIEFERKADISRASVDRLDRFSMYQCAHRCLRKILCFAYDYNPKSKECVLVGANTYVAKGEPWVYYEITKLIKTPQCAAFSLLPDFNRTLSYPTYVTLMYQCGETCYKNNTCFAFDYKTDSNECLLVDTKTYVVKGGPWVYYEITKLIKTPQCN